MKNINFKWFCSPDNLSYAFYVRTKVFIEEQGCPPELEFDGIDQIAQHIVVFDANNNPLATGRIFETSQGQAKIGRAAVLKKYRGKGYGAVLIKECVKRLFEQNYPDILIHAQTYAIPFYEKLGFSAFGKEFMEDGLPHTQMLCKGKT